MAATTHEPTNVKITELAKKPGTHYFHVGFRSLVSTRSYLYSEVKRAKHTCHTNYDSKKEVLRVVITDE